MRQRWLLAAPAALLLWSLPAQADVLVMQDGRQIQGELVQINRGVVWFDEQTGARARRHRVSVVDVARIDFNLGDEGIDVAPRAVNPEHTVTVRPDVRWVDTGLDLRAGETLRLQATGTVVWAPDRTTGPAGRPKPGSDPVLPMPDGPAGALIGRIGAGGDIFLVGDDSGVIRARTSGRLYLTLNDDYLADNSGSYQVRISR